MPAKQDALLRRAIAPGPVIGALLSGALLYIPTHSLGSVVGMALVMFLLLGGLRAADHVLAPVWAGVGRIPSALRRIGAVVLPLLFAISRFGADAAGEEVSRTRWTLVICTLVAYVLLRPGRSPA